MRDMKEGDEVCLVPFGGSSDRMRAKLIRKVVFMSFEYGGGQYEVHLLAAWELETAEGVRVVDERYLSKLI